MIIKTNTASQMPDLQKIQDKMTKEFSRDLIDLISRTIRNAYDDIVALEKTERVTALPTADLSHRGKFVLWETTGAVADGLYLCVDTGGGAYAWKKVTVAT